MWAAWRAGRELTWDQVGSVMFSSSYTQGDVRAGLDSELHWGEKREVARWGQWGSAVRNWGCTKGRNSNTDRRFKARMGQGARDSKKMVAAMGYRPQTQNYCLGGDDLQRKLERYKLRSWWNARNWVVWNTLNKVRAVTAQQKTFWLKSYRITIMTKAKPLPGHSEPADEGNWKVKGR